MIEIIYTGESRQELAIEIRELKKICCNFKIFVDPKYYHEFFNTPIPDGHLPFPTLFYEDVEVTSIKQIYNNRNQNQFIKELTISDIAKKFGTTPDRIKIIEKKELE